MANYYSSGSIEIFPSSNSIDNGKVTSEQNIRNIVKRLKLKNYKMGSKQFELEISSSNEIAISSGVALIDGYRIEASSYTIKEYPNDLTNGDYYVIMTINMNDDGKIKGDLSGNCEGVIISVVPTSTKIGDTSLILGTATYNGSWTEVETNETSIYPFSSNEVMLDDVSSAPDGSITSEINTLKTGYVNSKENATKTGNLMLGTSDNSNVILLDPATKSITIYNSTNVKMRESFNNIRFYDSVSNYSSINGSGTSISLGIKDTNYLSISSSSGIELNGRSKDISIKTAGNKSILLDNGIYSLNIISTGIKCKNNSTDLLSINSTESIIGNLKISGSNPLTLGIKDSSNNSISFSNPISGTSATLTSLTIGSNVLSTSGLTIGSATTIGSNIDTTGTIKSGDSSNNSIINKNVISIRSASSGTSKINFISGSNTIGYISGDSSTGIEINCSKVKLSSSEVTVTGSLTASKVYNAAYNGFGEIFRKPADEVIEYGDVVCIGQDGLVHKMSENHSLNRIIGICSNTIGVELGGSDIPDDERVEVELIGKILVKTDYEFILPGSLITFTIDGKARVKSESDIQHAIALSNVKDGKVLVYYSGLVR